MFTLVLQMNPSALRTDPVHGRGPKERDDTTYMGQDYYLQWLDNLAEDVSFEAAAMDGIRPPRRATMPC